jgi:hypothetical protein
MPTITTLYTDMTTHEGLGRLANSGQYADWAASYIDDLPLGATSATLTVYLSCTQVWKGQVGVRCGTIRLSDCPFLAHVPATKGSLWLFEVDCDGFVPEHATIVCQSFSMCTLCEAQHTARPTKTFGYGVRRGQFATVNVVSGNLVI